MLTYYFFALKLSQKNKTVSKCSVETLFRLKAFTLLCGRFIPDTVYQILSQSAEVCRGYQKTFWPTTFPDMVHNQNVQFFVWGNTGVLSSPN